MKLMNFLLTLHILGVIIAFGPTFVFPLVGAIAQQPGAPVAWLLKVNHAIEWKLTVPLATTLVPGAGAGLIIAGGWDPFEKPNRWLLASIILYTITYAIAMGPSRIAAGKATALAEEGAFGPEFGKHIKTAQMTGILMTVFFFVIAILMITKPGSGFIHA